MTALYLISIIIFAFATKIKWIIPAIILHEFLLIGLTTWNILPNLILHGYDVMILCLFLRLLNFKYEEKNSLSKIILLICIYSLLTMLVFATPIDAFLMGARILIIPLLLVYIFTTIRITSKLFKLLVKWMIYIGILESVISFGQFLYFGGTGDWAGGSLGSGGTNQLMLFQISLIAYILDRSLFDKNLNLPKVFLILILSIPIVVGSSKLGIILLPLIFLLFTTKYQLNFKFNLQAIVMLGLMAYLSFYIFNGLISERDKEVLFDQEQMSTYNDAGVIDEGRSISRGSIVPITIDFLQRNENIYTGVGLGNLYYSETVSGNRINSTNRYMATRSGFVKVFGELGLIGFLLYLLFYWKLWKSAVPDKFVKKTNVSYFCFATILILQFLANTFYSGTYFKGAPNVFLLIIFGYLFSKNNIKLLSVIKNARKLAIRKEQKLANVHP
ncbi:MAG: hypothetical protein J0H29_19640 [Sphingobacteriales bacterium]|nr:hypothetical protein [Sphingobacteriales bacterium]OJY81219.1 MAG: hypothetical protein BGP14_08425 [Sphingobacteriales bacterium 44-15]